MQEMRDGRLVESRQERLELLYSRARRYGRDTSLRRENRGEMLESKQGPKARLGGWTKQDEDNERRRGLRLRLIRE